MFEVRLRVRTVLGDTHVSGYYDDRELALDVFTILSEQGEFVEFIVHPVPDWVVKEEKIARLKELLDF